MVGETSALRAQQRGGEDSFSRSNRSWELLCRDAQLEAQLERSPKQSEHNPKQSDVPWSFLLSASSAKPIFLLSSWPEEETFSKMSSEKGWAKSTRCSQRKPPHWGWEPAWASWDSRSKAMPGLPVLNGLHWFLRFTVLRALKCHCWPRNTLQSPQEWLMCSSAWRKECSKYNSYSATCLIQCTDFIFLLGTWGS